MRVFGVGKSFEASVSVDSVLVLLTFSCMWCFRGRPRPRFSDGVISAAGGSLCFEGFDNKETDISNSCSSAGDCKEAFYNNLYSIKKTMSGKNYRSRR